MTWPRKQYSVNYKRTSEDYLCFAALATRPHQTTFAVVHGVSLLISVASAVFIASAVVDEKTVSQPIQTMILLTIMFVLHWAISRVVMRHLAIEWVDEAGNYCEAKTLSITEDGVSEESEFNKIFSDWRGVRKLHQTAEYLYFFVDNSQAYCIPVRAFESKDMATQFFAQAEAFWRAANNVPDHAEVQHDEHTQ